MKKFPKAGLLIITLVIPALIFTLLKLFGTNHYDLPYFVAEKDGNGSIIVQNGDTLFHQVSADCGVFGGVNLDGRLTVVSRMPSNCGEPCERAIDELERIAALKAAIPELQVLSIASDTVRRGEWRSLKADSGTIASCFSKELTDSAKGSDASNGRAGQIVLIDRNKHVRGFYKAGDGEETGRLMAEIKILDYEKKNEK
jgi:protein SCO1/2